MITALLLCEFINVVCLEGEDFEVFACFERGFRSGYADGALSGHVFQRVGQTGKVAGFCAEYLFAYPDAVLIGEAREVEVVGSSSFCRR